MAHAIPEEEAINRFDLATALDAMAFKARYRARFYRFMPGQTWRVDRQYAIADGLEGLRDRVLDGTVPASSVDDEARALLAAIPDLPDDDLEGGTAP
jgi:hypothetical protein